MKVKKEKNANAHVLLLKKYYLKELVRIAATKEGNVSVDLNGKAPGRGAI